MPHSILAVFGTRPEATKMAPVVKSLLSQKDLETIVCVTGQHRNMLDQVLDAFSIKPDVDLNVMETNQTVPQLSAKVLESISEVIRARTPNLVLVHGDTATSAAAAMASYFNKIPIGHVEAGLRTNDIYSPWPEEGNRRVISSLSTLHFSPTPLSKANLLTENIAEERVFITGNTVIDALLHASKSTRTNIQELLNSPLDPNKKVVLVTAHRRENFGRKLRCICEAVLRIADREDVEIIFPVHPNPNVSDTVHAHLSGVENINLIEPVDYFSFIKLMDRSYIVLTDSGGIQEEAPSLGKPVLVMREVTERTEAIEAGTVRLVGAETTDIVEKAHWLLDDERGYQEMSSKRNPYGDGKASDRITSVVRQFLKNDRVDNLDISQSSHNNFNAKHH